MATRGKPIPSKLKHDAIVEALFEARFNMETLPELFFGRLADYEPFQSFERRRMPAHDIPPFVRENDPSFRYQSIFELSDFAGHRAVRIGPHVLSYHRTAPYVGWATFKLELEA